MKAGIAGFFIACTFAFGSCALRTEENGLHWNRAFNLDVGLSVNPNAIRKTKKLQYFCIYFIDEAQMRCQNSGHASNTHLHGQPAGDNEETSVRFVPATTPRGDRKAA